MFYSIRSKLVISFLCVTVLVGTVSLMVGGQLIYDSVVSEVGNRVRQDLNVARLLYDKRGRDTQQALEILCTGSDFEAALAGDESALLTMRLKEVAHRMDLDFAGIVRPDGSTFYRIGQDSKQWASTGANPVARAALNRKKAVSGTVVLDEPILRAEAPELPSRARTLPMPLAGKDVPAIGENTALSIAGAAPLFQSQRLLGAIYGGIILNGETGIVDTIGETVFQNEVYEGRSVGTATIFLGNLRIATSVRRPDGERAIGTFASEDVVRRVLAEGEKWIDRALVVGDWYITAYEPIRDIFNRRVGMLYVGILEAQYADVRKAALEVFTIITLACVGLALLAGLGLADRIVRPINRLIQASIKVSGGNLSPKIGPISKGDFGVLQKEFQKMIQALKEREQRQKEEREVQLVQSQKHANIGRLAAGVAHEINNPLTAVLTYTHLTLRRQDLPEDVRVDLEVVALQTERVRRIVKGLLDFARQSRPELSTVSLNRLLADGVRLIENQALVQGVKLHFAPGAALPDLTLDRNQFQSVIINMMINALDATESGGSVTVASRRSSSREPGVEIIVQDTGCGIAPEDLERIFEPFYTTKEVGKGTGLGLSVSAGIVARHGGSIGVRSTLAEGSTFTIWLPIKGDEHEETRTAEREHGHAHLDRR